ncbi:hypothetical protein HSB1_01080 [Halogranum salarium B-1]|uniref:Uncharacterized protein n=1 Tax=Halogranum salarium B-1 TaxID=1210908 RepID=J3EZL1_9EURY|nr:hypothetical protein HSB1_01080 [Halogranum salarium B-1]
MADRTTVGESIARLANPPVAVERAGVFTRRTEQDPFPVWGEGRLRGL